MSTTLYGYAVDSEIPLSRAPRAQPRRGTVMIHRSEEELLARDGELISWDDREGNQFALASSGRELLAWCSVTGSYLLCGDAGSIVARPEGRHAHWEHRIGATIVPLLLAERGDLALHAAAIRHGNRAVLLCGPPGRGKSTLSAALALNDLDVLSEDGAVISSLQDEPLTWPGQIGVRIPTSVLAALEGRADGAPSGEKTTQLLRTPALAPARVGAVILLAPPGGSEPQLEHVDPVAALPALMPHALYGGPNRLERTLGVVAQLVERVPVYRGRLPRDLPRAREHAAALMKLARRSARPD